MLDLVICVRGDLTKMEKISFNAIIVIDVHAQDVIEKLGNDGIGNKEHFRWI